MPENEIVLQSMMQNALYEFNAKSSGKQVLDIVFFNSVFEKVFKINRSLHNYGCNTLLIAHEGSGSSELVKIAIQLSDWVDVVIYEKDSEGDEDWTMQLKDCLSRVMGLVEDKRTVLHIEERDLTSSGMLEALNAIAAHSDIF